MKDCVFCKIVRKELPSYMVYEDDATIAILDIHPVAPGHTLVIPKHDASYNILDIPEADWLAMSRVVHRLAPVVEKALGADGINIAMNNREHAGQVVDHPHVHLIPRFKGDGFRGWPHGSYKEGEADATLASIRRAL